MNIQEITKSYVEQMIEARKMGDEKRAIDLLKELNDIARDFWEKNNPEEYFAESENTENSTGA